MYFSASEKLLKSRAPLAPVVRACDGLFGALPVNAVLTRAAIAQQLKGLNASQVSSILDDLVRDGVIDRRQGRECPACETVNFFVGACTFCQAALQLASSVDTYVVLAERSENSGTDEDSLGNSSIQEKPHATMGVIVALRAEFAAIQHVLHLEQKWFEKGRGSSRTFRYGEVVGEDGKKHIVVGLLLPTMGNNSAATSAMILQTAFPSVRDIIMCGIAGGIRSDSNDLRLGDVVISNKFGVIQYDMGKSTPGGFEMNPYPRPPSARLTEGVENLLTRELLGERPWDAYIEQARTIDRAARPHDSAGAKEGHDISYSGPPRKRPGVPVVSSGKIGSANQVLRDVAKHPDLIAQGIIAVEMEGSGIADATWTEQNGYLVIRGIADHADSNKGDVWHGYASVAAASVLRVLLENIPAG